MSANALGQGCEGLSQVSYLQLRNAVAVVLLWVSME